MSGGPVVIIIDPDGDDQKVQDLSAADVRPQSQADADRIRALADRVERGELQVRFAR